MARKTDIPRVQNPPSGDGHHITSRYMTATELAEREARLKSHDDMLARQQAYEDRFVRQPQQPGQSSVKGCVFAKSCNLPDGVINHDNPTGFVPVEKLTDYGKFSLLGGRERDEAGNIPLKKISGSALPRSFGTLILGGVGAAGSGAAASGCGGSDDWCCCWRFGGNRCVALAIDARGQFPVFGRTAQITQRRSHPSSPAY